MSRTLTQDQARDYYDRFGARQDDQHYYEDPATNDLIAHARFSNAQSVIEFGCGTGRFAHTLLTHHLSDQATYLAIDQSTAMVKLAQDQLKPFDTRVRVLQTNSISLSSESCDRFISNYVLDLLSDQDIHTLLQEAHRLLQPGGLLGLVGLTNGFSLFSKIVSKTWNTIHTLRPQWVGGCRPLELHTYLFKPQWQIIYANKLAPYGIPSEILIALKPQ